MEEGDGGGFDVGCEGGVFDLDGVDVVGFAGAAEGGGGDFGEAEVFDFSLSIYYFSQFVCEIRGRMFYFFNSAIASTVFSTGVTPSTR